MDAEDDATEADGNEGGFDDAFDNQSEQCMEVNLMQPLAHPNDQEADPFLDCDISLDSIDEMNTNQTNAFDHMPSPGRIQTPNPAIVPSENEAVAQNDAVSLNEITSTKMEPVPLYEANTSNVVDLDDILDDDEVVDVYSNDVTIIFKRKTGIIKPMKTDSNGLVKRENDVVSGNMAYNDTVRN